MPGRGYVSGLRGVAVWSGANVLRSTSRRSEPFVPTRTAQEIIDAARARFDDGEHRAAWDSLLVWARREPGERAYRDALSEFYRRAGNPDQAARWGAHDLARLDDRERRALRRSLLQFDTEKQVRAYLVLPAGLPSEVTEHLGSRRHQSLVKWGQMASDWERAAIVASAVGGVGVLLGLVVIVVMAFIGDPEAQSATQALSTLALAAAVVIGVLWAVASGLRGWSMRSCLFAALVIGAGLLLARADMTSPLPFG